MGQRTPLLSAKLRKYDSIWPFVAVVAITAASVGLVLVENRDSQTIKPELVSIQTVPGRRSGPGSNHPEFISSQPKVACLFLIIPIMQSMTDLVPPDQLLLRSILIDKEFASIENDLSVS